MRGVITVSRTVGGGVVAVNLMRVTVVVVRASTTGRWRNVDPLLLPLPHRPSEHRGRPVPRRGPPESGPHSLHVSPIWIGSDSASDPSNKNLLLLLFRSLYLKTDIAGFCFRSFYGFPSLAGIGWFREWVVSVLANQGRPKHGTPFPNRIMAFCVCVWYSDFANDWGNSMYELFVFVVCVSLEGDLLYMWVD